MRLEEDPNRISRCGPCGVRTYARCFRKHECADVLGAAAQSRCNCGRDACAGRCAEVECSEVAVPRGKQLRREPHYEGAAQLWTPGGSRFQAACASARRGIKGPDSVQTRRQVTKTDGYARKGHW